MKLELPEAWLNTMSTVRRVLPSAYLAGGALRDLDNGRPVKDLDVFFTEADWHYEALEDGLAKMGYFYKSECPGQYMDGAAQEVYSSSTYESTEGGPELNLIQLEPSFNPASIVDRVDFGLCQIGYGIMGVDATEAYKHDKANEVFTLTRAETVEGVVRSLKRWHRLKQKYVGWDLEWKTEHNDLVVDAFEIFRREQIIETTIADTF